MKTLTDGPSYGVKMKTLVRNSAKLRILLTIQDGNTEHVAKVPRDVVDESVVDSPKDNPLTRDCQSLQLGHFLDHVHIRRQFDSPLW